MKWTVVFLTGLLGAVAWLTPVSLESLQPRWSPSTGSLTPQALPSVRADDTAVEVEAHAMLDRRAPVAGGSLHANGPGEFDDTLSLSLDP
jgi:hypothetical protein